MDWLAATPAPMRHLGIRGSRSPDRRTSPGTRGIRGYRTPSPNLRPRAPPAARGRSGPGRFEMTRSHEVKHANQQSRLAHQRRQPSRILRPLPSPLEIDQQTQQPGRRWEQLCDRSLSTIGSAIGAHQALEVICHLGARPPPPVRCDPLDDRGRPRDERRQLHVQGARQTCQRGHARPSAADPAQASQQDLATPRHDRPTPPASAHEDVAAAEAGSGSSRRSRMTHALHRGYRRRGPRTSAATHAGSASRSTSSGLRRPPGTDYESRPPRFSAGSRCARSSSGRAAARPPCRAAPYRP